MSALTNAILAQYPSVFGHAPNPLADTSEYVIVHGTVTREDDPMWDGRHGRVVKMLRIADLPATVARWLALGRTITNVHYHDYR